MGLRDEFRFDELENVALDLVIDALDQQLGDRAASLDQETVLDLAAFALNLLRPMYRTSLLGRVYAPAFQAQYEAEVVQAVDQAIAKIL